MMEVVEPEAPTIWATLLTRPESGGCAVEGGVGLWLWLRLCARLCCCRWWWVSRAWWEGRGGGTGGPGPTAAAFSAPLIAVTAGAVQCSGVDGDLQGGRGGS